MTDAAQGFFDFNENPVARAFRLFHNENPHVYELFKRFAREAKGTGRPRFSGRTIIERMRWYTAVEAHDPAGFKINDHWSPFYVRLIERHHPEFIGFFEKRNAIADDEDAA